MVGHQKIALGYFGGLTLFAALNYIPGLTDDQGRAFGIFALDIFDDVLHLGSALWALVAAIMSKRVANLFLTLFGALYFADGAMGLGWGRAILVWAT